MLNLHFLIFSAIFSVASASCRGTPAGPSAVAGILPYPACEDFAMAVAGRVHLSRAQYTCGVAYSMNGTLGPNGFAAIRVESTLVNKKNWASQAAVEADSRRPAFRAGTATQGRATVRHHLKGEAVSERRRVAEVPTAPSVMAVTVCAEYIVTYLHVV